MKRRVTMYYTALYWRDVPEVSPWFDTDAEVADFEKSFKKRVRDNGNLSFKFCKEPKYEQTQKTSP